ncbi:sorcin [Rhipicephalus sanguineus]|uniref:EF-hand domain-containing protein n=1 Tax=Rhipicephalus sanguineus TaxID=34632 RepID=A0A9D4YQR7_RHISA|nr:sorcin [Rhipicephalus sanguineus]KAH7984314.1 hypothetical protein HPB52_019176 [Rhipicephalus sanguineus]
MSSCPGSDYERYLVDVFLEADKDASGFLDVHQLRAALYETVAYPRYRAFSLKTTSLLMAVVNLNNQGFLTMQQFFWLHQTVYRFWKAFRKYDLDNCGWIWHTDVRAVMACIRLQVTDDQMEEVLGLIEHRTWVSLEEYVQLCSISILSRYNI